MNGVLRFWSVSRPAQTQEIPSVAFIKAIHSNGTSQRIRVVTGEVEPAAPRDSSDVVIFAPSARPTDRPLSKALDEAVAAMGPGGVLYAVTPRQSRRKILRLLRRHGLEIGGPRLRLRSGAAKYYVPLTARSFRFAIDSWSLPRRWHFVMWLLNTIPGSCRFLSFVLPRVGFAAFRPESRPFSWLLSRLAEMPGEALVATSWRLTEAAALVFGFAGSDPTPIIVAKQAPASKRARAYHEANMLGQVAPIAQQAGVGVPRLIELLDDWGQTYVLETGVPGRPLSQRLARWPADLSTVVHKLSTWLEAWHQNSVQRAALTSAECEEMILSPARSLAEELLDGSQYLAWLAGACSQLIGTEVPWVNTHNDLTMANVLQDDYGRIFVVDWEVARARGLPLADFWYSACDAATACGSQDRATTFNQCFLKEGGLSALVAQHDQRLREIVGGPPEWLELCFHACWLQHAVNEQVERTPGESSPFLAIVNALGASALDHTGSTGVLAKRRSGSRQLRSRACP